MSRYHDKCLVLYRFADELARLSACTRQQNAAIVFANDCSAVYSIGYNGPARGRPNSACNGEEGNCGCVHAEANALLRASCGGVMYCTTSPCMMCAQMLLNHGGIYVLVYDKQYRDPSGIQMLADYGVAVHRREDDVDFR